MELKEENKQKYGAKGSDLVSRRFDISFERGATFCIDNVEKYATRYISDSVKKALPSDKEKIKDYLHRIIERGGGATIKYLVPLLDTDDFELIIKFCNMFAHYPQYMHVSKDSPKDYVKILGELEN